MSKKIEKRPVKADKKNPKEEASKDKKETIKKVKQPEIIENLGTLKLKKTSSIFVGLLPSNYKAVLVNYEIGSAAHSYYNLRGIRISCLIPSESHQVQVAYEKYDSDYDYDDDEYGETKVVKHKSLPTLFSIFYPDFPKGETCQNVMIHAVNPKAKNKIMAAPYELPNVSDGYICFGSVGSPKDLRSAHTLFWNSPFNGSGQGDDYGSDARSNLDWIRRYKNLVDHDYDDLTSEVCGSKFWSTTQAAEGVLVTNNQELLKQVPEKFWLRNSENQPLLIALASLTENNTWKFWSKGFCFEVEAQNINTPRSSNKKLINVVQKLIREEKKLNKPQETAEAKKAEAKKTLKV